MSNISQIETVLKKARKNQKVVMECNNNDTEFPGYVVNLSRTNPKSIKVEDWFEGWPEEDCPLCFIAEEDGAKLSLGNVDGKYQISYDEYNWTDYKLGDWIILEKKNDRVFFKAKTVNSTCWNNQYSDKFNINNGKIKAFGNIQSLLKWEKWDNYVPRYCFAELFIRCKDLTRAPLLPSTNIEANGYFCMFYECTSLTSIPYLPSKFVGAYGYAQMFNKCSSLKISENGTEGSIVLNMPTDSQTQSNWNENMFSGTNGTFKGKPQIGKVYRCYQ